MAPVGENLVERVLAGVLLEDLVSVYLAALDGVDPTPVEAIDRLKAELQDLRRRRPRRAGQTLTKSW